MPEGPEIRRAADGIAKVLVGKPLADVYFAFPELTDYEDALIGAVVAAVDTRGKAMLTRFDNGLTLYSHNQLYGRWYTCKRDRPPSTKRSLRVALHTDTHSALLYSASDVAMLTPETESEHPFLCRVGPDILDATLTPAAVAKRLSDKRFRNRSLGALYLDQTYLAGIGNYLRSEILFVSGEHPASRPADLDKAALRRLAKATLDISRRSYRTKGVTVPDRLAKQLKADGQTFQKYRFFAYGRDGKACHTCGTTIERMDVGSRGLYYCPRCQPMR